MPETTVAVDWKAVRAEFPPLERWTYLNTATFGQLPRRSVEAMTSHFARRDERACSDFLTWFNDADALRASIAQLIHAQPADIALMPNASSTLAMVINGLDWRPGDRLVTLEREFPNNVYFPALLASRGAEFVESSWERIEEAISPATRLVLLSEVNYANGFRAPLKELSALARRRGAMLYVDGTQSLGALQVDVREFQPDVYAVHGYKWLLSPPGAGFMYVSPAAREALRPSVIGWRSHRGWRDVDNLHNGSPEFSADAEKYEAGVLPFPLLYGMKASVEMFLELTPEAVEQRVMELAGKLRDTLRRAGARLLCDEHPHFDSPVLAARFPGRDPQALCAALKQRRVLISSRYENLRISTHLYNNEADLARLAEELEHL